VQIILIPGRLAKARTVTFSPRLLVLIGLLCLTLASAMAASMYWMLMREAARIETVFPSVFAVSVQKKDEERARAFVQQNLNAMAVKLGEMQAQLTRLDALGERLSSTAGIREFRFAEAPGLGGATPTMMPPQNLSLAEFGEKLSVMSRNMENRTDMLGVLEAQLFEQAVKKKAMPTPWSSCGSAMVAKSALVLKCARQNATAANTTKPKVASARGSVLPVPSSRATSGDSSTAKTPPGAIA